MARLKECLVCGSGALTVVLKLDGIPIQCSSLIASREEALDTAKGDVTLVFCSDCGHIFNADFNPDLVNYDGAYENSLDCSPRFAAYLERIASGLLSRYHLSGRHVLEIGCGQAGLLKLFIGMGAKAATGFDPSYVPGPGTEDSRLTVFRKFFTPDCVEGPADLVCCRQTLEHIFDPVAFLSAIRKAFEGTAMPPVFVEVPNGPAMFDQNAVWDIIYPHVSYFTASSLATAFRKSGLEPGRAYTTFGGQFLCLEAASELETTNAPVINGASVTDVADAAERFSQHYMEMVGCWKDYLTESAARGRKTVIWGSGAKAVSFMNAMGGTGGIEVAVDINPRKQGMFLPGAGQEIVSPAFLQEYRPDSVIVMNPIYASEVGSDLGRMGLACKVLTADEYTQAVGVAG